LFRADAGKKIGHIEITHKHTIQLIIQMVM
jgi:hypothetical protein